MDLIISGASARLALRESSREAGEREADQRLCKNMFFLSGTLRTPLLPKGEAFGMYPQARGAALKTREVFENLDKTS